jgi:hypothetical protein
MSLLMSGKATKRPNLRQTTDMLFYLVFLSLNLLNQDQTGVHLRVNEHWRWRNFVLR